MEKITDWNALWRELVEIKANSRKGKFGKPPQEDIWADRAQDFKEGVKRKWARPDSSREFILSNIDADSAQKVLLIMAELRHKGCTIVVATHDVEIFRSGHPGSCGFEVDAIYRLCGGAIEAPIP